MTLYLLNHELARIRSVVTEPGLGAIRFQWWRDALAELPDGNLYRHDVIGALAEQVEAGLLNVEALQKLVDGHEAAFHAKDRKLEPDRRLTAMAAQTLAPMHGWGACIELVAPHVAALKRGENVGYGPVISQAPGGIRPAIAHFRLRRILGKPATGGGAIARRICVMRAILTGVV